MKIKTVKIDRNGSPVVINATDFRYGSDKLWGAPEDKAPAAVERSDVKISHKGGGRWIVEVNGQKTHDGYLKKAAAKALAEQY